jgi:hypothetical protein
VPNGQTFICIAAASINRGPDFQSIAHVHVGSKLSYYKLHGGIAQHEKSMYST